MTQAVKGIGILLGETQGSLVLAVPSRRLGQLARRRPDRFRLVWMGPARRAVPCPGWRGSFGWRPATGPGD